MTDETTTPVPAEATEEFVPLTAVLEDPRYQGLDGSQRTGILDKWHRKTRASLNEQGAWTPDTWMSTEIAVRQEKERNLGLETLSTPEEIVADIQAERLDKGNKRKALFETLAKVDAAEQAGDATGMAKILPALADTLLPSGLRKTVDNALQRHGKQPIQKQLIDLDTEFNEQARIAREGETELGGAAMVENARKAAAVASGKSEDKSAVVAGTLLIRPDLYLNKDAFVAAVKESGASDEEKAEALADYEYVAPEVTKNFAETHLPLVSFRSFARDAKAKNPDATDADILWAYKEGNHGKWEKAYLSAARGTLSAFDTMSYAWALAGKTGDILTEGSTSNAGLAAQGTSRTLEDMGIGLLADSAKAKDAFGRDIDTMGGQGFFLKTLENAVSIAPTILGGMGGSALGAAVTAPGRKMVEKVAAKEIAAATSGLALSKAKKAFGTKMLPYEQFSSMLTQSSVLSAAGLQSAGGTFYESYQNSRKRLAGEGLTGEALEDAAREEAFAHANRTGLITLAITAGMNQAGTFGGLESSVNRYLNKVASSPTARAALTDSIKQAGQKLKASPAWQFASTTAKSTAGEAFEEGLDTAVNRLLDAAQDKVKLTPDEYLSEIAESAKMGAVLGGVPGVAEGVAAGLRAKAAASVENSPEIAAKRRVAEQLRASGLNDAAAALEANADTAVADFAESELAQVEDDLVDLENLDEVIADMEAREAELPPEETKDLADLRATREVLTETLAPENADRMGILTRANTVKARLVDAGVDEAAAANLTVQGIRDNPDAGTEQLTALLLPKAQEMAATATQATETTEAPLTFEAAKGRPVLVDGEPGDLTVDEDGTVLLERKGAAPLILSRDATAPLDSTEFDIQIDNDFEEALNQSQNLDAALPDKDLGSYPFRPSARPVFVRQSDGAVITTAPGSLESGPNDAVSDFVETTFDDAGELTVKLRSRSTGAEFDLVGDDALEAAVQLRARDKAPLRIVKARPPTAQAVTAPDREDDAPVVTSASSPEAQNMERVLARYARQMPTALAATDSEISGQLTNADIEQATTELAATSTALQNDPNLTPDVKARVAAVLDDVLGEVAALQRKATAVQQPVAGDATSGSPAPASPARGRAARRVTNGTKKGQGPALDAAARGKRVTITPAQDADYAAAVERGDTEAALKMVEQAENQLFPRAGKTLGDLEIGSKVPNQDSIESTMVRLKGVRTVPLDPRVNYVTVDDQARVQKIAEEIQRNKRIDPLIAVYNEKTGLFILEGNHRQVALSSLGYTEAPALVVIDREEAATHSVMHDGLSPNPFRVVRDGTDTPVARAATAEAAWDLAEQKDTETRLKRDAKGNLIPLSERFILNQGPALDAAPRGRKSLVTPQQDAAYLAAVESGDMETAQRMVDEAAKAAGYNVGPVYHGSWNPDITVFDRAHSHEVGVGSLGFFTTSQKRAEGWATDGGKVYKVFLRSESPITDSNELNEVLHRWARSPDYIEGVDAFSTKPHDSLDDNGNVIETEVMEWVVKDPNQIKSADPVTRDSAGNVIPLSQRFNPESDSILYASPKPRQVPAFFSALEQAVESRLPDTMTAAQAKAVVNQSGVRPAELQWAGYDSMVDTLATEGNGKIAKADLLNMLRNERQTGIVDVVNHATGELPSGYVIERAEPQPKAGLAKRLSEWVEKDTDETIRRITFNDPDTGERVSFADVLTDLASPTLTDEAASEYLPWLRQVEPKSQSFRDALSDIEWAAQPFQTNPSRVQLTLKGPRGKVIGTFETKEQAVETALIHRRETSLFREYEQWQLPGGRNYRETVITAPRTGPASDFRPVHYPDIENYVAHSRSNERIDSTGTEGVFIEEAQSDLHQPSVAKKMENPAPDAPFKNNWPVQLFKRALRDAVESGLDWVGWTSGDTQIARYDLSKVLSRIDITRQGDDFVVTAITRQNVPALTEEVMTAEEMTEYFGKDLAARIAENPPADGATLTLTEDNLRLENRGMREFYDKMLPRQVKEYLKSWGGTVEQGTLPDGTVFWKVPVTETMRDSILSKGQPLYHQPVRPIFNPGPRIADLASLPESMPRGERVRSMAERLIRDYPNLNVSLDSTIPGLGRFDQGDILLNPEELDATTEGMPDYDAQAVVEKIFQHETMHQAGVDSLSREEAVALGRDLPVELREETARSYLSRDAYDTDADYESAIGEFLADNNDAHYGVAHEYLRQTLERVMTGRTTEELIADLSDKPNLLQRVLRYLRAAMTRLKEMLRVSRDPKLAVILTRMRAGYDALIAGEVPIDMGEPAFNPAQFEEGVVALNASRWGRKQRMPIFNSPVVSGYQSGGAFSAAGLYDPRIFAELQRSRQKQASAVKEAEYFAAQLDRFQKQFFGKDRRQWPTDLINTALGTTENRLTPGQAQQIRDYKKAALAHEQSIFLTELGRARRYDTAVANGTSFAGLRGQQATDRAAKIREDARAAFKAGVAAYTTAAQQSEGLFRAHNRNVARAARKAALRALPPEMAKHISRMRVKIDALGRELRRNGFISGNLAATISQNSGLWIHRSYRIFDQENWAEWVEFDKDPEAEAIRNRAMLYCEAELRREYIAQATKGPNAVSPAVAAQNAAVAVTQDQIQERFMDYLSVADKTVTNIIQGATVSKPMEIVMKRGIQSDAIRELWGEHKDPAVNAAKSLSSLAGFTATEQFYHSIREQGLAEGWLSTGTMSRDGQRLVPLFPKGRTRFGKTTPDPRYSPLDGLNGPPALRDALTETSNAKHHPWWLKGFLALTGYSMMTKTALSVQSTVRNFVGNVGFIVANGHMTGLPKNFKDAAILSFHNLFNRGRRETRNTLNYLVELGIIGDSGLEPLLNELMSLSNTEDKAVTVAGKVWDKTLIGPALKKLSGKAAEFYGAQDDFWKVVAFASERARVRGYSPASMTDAEVDVEAARIVRDTMPTYSLAPKIIQQLRRVPFLAPFITFTSEVIRTSTNLLKLAANQIRAGHRTGNAKLAQAGYARLTGFSTVTIGTSAILKTAAYLLGGYDDDDERDLREHLAPWEQNAQIIPLKRVKEGEVRYINASFANPYDVLMRPFRALFNKLGDPDAGGVDVAAETVEELLDPVAREQIFFGSIVDVMRGVTETGQKVFDKQDSWMVKKGKSLAHIWKQALEPGTITSGRRIARGFEEYVSDSNRAYNAKDEIQSVILGQKIQSVNLAYSAERAARTFGYEQRDATSAFTRHFTSPGTKTERQLIDAYLDASEKRLRVHRELRQKVMSAIRLGGLTAEDAEIMLRENRVSEATVGNLFDNELPRYEPSKNSLEQGERNGEKRGQDRLEILDRAKELVPDYQPISAGE